MILKLGIYHHRRFQSGGEIKINIGAIEEMSVSTVRTVGYCEMAVRTITNRTLARGLTSGRIYSPVFGMGETTLPA